MEHSRYKRPESILVVVYTIEPRVLLLRRRQPVNFWQSVTGSLEWDETPKQAAHREIKEETGLSCQGLVDCHQSHTFKIFPRWRRLYAPGVTENLEHVFRLRTDNCADIMLDPAEHEAYMWLSKHDALQWVSSYTNRDAIQEWVPDRKKLF